MDIYVVDTSDTDINGHPTTNNTNLGDVEIDALFPDQDITTGWGSFGGDGTHAYTCVNETAPDDDTSYVLQPPLVQWKHSNTNPSPPSLAQSSVLSTLCVLRKPPKVLERLLCNWKVRIFSLLIFLQPVTTYPITTSTTSLHLIQLTVLLGLQQYLTPLPLVFLLPANVYHNYLG